jgi:hypothetical protein
MSLRARAIATTGVLWALLVGAAIVTTVRRGGMKVVVGAEPGSTLTFETHYDLTRLFTWIGAISTVAVAAIVITYALTIRSASQAADEFAYEVVPSDRTGETNARRHRFELTA